jgi:ubiquinone/menaquinone biosynthesis C-methylase UbiE
MLSDKNGKTVPVGSQVLDIGCADGNLTAKIAAYLPKSKVTGVDLYKKSIEFASKKNSSIEFLVADARKLPFKNKKFDTIICVEALEHIPDNSRAVLEIKRCLKDSGRFIILQDTDSPVFNFIWFFWTKWKGKVWEGSHISCMKPKELVTLLKKNGFKVKDKKFSHFGLEVAISAVKK